MGTLRLIQRGSKDKARCCSLRGGVFERWATRPRISIGGVVRVIPASFQASRGPLVLGPERQWECSLGDAWSFLALNWVEYTVNYGLAVAQMYASDKESFSSSSES